MSARRWTIKLGGEAERDFSNILGWTAERFGARQAGIYLTTLSAAIDALTEGPQVAGARARHDLAPGLFCLHVRRQRRKGRHVLYFRAIESERDIVVIRILHDSMDAARYLGAESALPANEA